MPNSLLDKVLDNKDNPTVDFELSPKDDKPHRAKDGSIVYDSTIAAINRIFSLNPHLNKRLSLRGNPQLFNGSKRVDLNNKHQLTELIRGDWEPKTEWQVTYLKEKVLEFAPDLSFAAYAITDDLYWDREDDKLKRVGDGDSIRTVS